MEMPALLTNDTWAALVEAEDGYGEGAEAHALSMAAAARSQGDDKQAHIWAAAADELHILHNINKQWAQPRDRPFGGHQPSA
jgi:hypothetical protein